MAQLNNINIEPPELADYVQDTPNADLELTSTVQKEETKSYESLIVDMLKNKEQCGQNRSKSKQPCTDNEKHELLQMLSSPKTALVELELPQDESDTKKPGKNSKLLFSKLIKHHKNNSISNTEDELSKMISKKLGEAAIIKANNANANQIINSKDDSRNLERVSNKYSKIESQILALSEKSISLKKKSENKFGASKHLRSSKEKKSNNNLNSLKDKEESGIVSAEQKESVQINLEQGRDICIATPDNLAAKLKVAPLNTHSERPKSKIHQGSKTSKSNITTPQNKVRDSKEASTSIAPKKEASGSLSNLNQLSIGNQSKIEDPVENGNLKVISINLALDSTDSQNKLKPSKYSNRRKTEQASQELSLSKNISKAKQIIIPAGIKKKSSRNNEVFEGKMVSTNENNTSASIMNSIKQNDKNCSFNTNNKQTESIDSSSEKFSMTNTKKANKKNIFVPTVKTDLYDIENNNNTNPLANNDSSHLDANKPLAKSNARIYSSKVKNINHHKLVKPTSSQDKMGFSSTTTTKENSESNKVNSIRYSKLMSNMNSSKREQNTSKNIDQDSFISNQDSNVSHHNFLSNFNSNCNEAAQDIKLSTNQNQSAFNSNRKSALFKSSSNEHTNQNIININKIINIFSTEDSKDMINKLNSEDSEEEKGCMKSNIHETRVSRKLQEARMQRSESKNRQEPNGMSLERIEKLRNLMEVNDSCSISNQEKLYLQRRNTINLNMMLDLKAGSPGRLLNKIRTKLKNENFQQSQNSTDLNFNSEKNMEPALPQSNYKAISPKIE